ncbi:MAG: hypothetical protein ACH350_09230 [Parachlamydiaceae bacterium]
MTFNISNRQFLSAAIIVFYLIPLLFFSVYSIKLMSYNKSWALLSLGLLIVFFGSLSLIFLLSHWEQSLRDRRSNFPHLVREDSHPVHSTNKETKVTLLDPSSMNFESIQEKEPLDAAASFKEDSKQISLLEAALKSHQSQEEELQNLLESKQEELRKKEEENKYLQMKAEQIAQDFSDYKIFSEEQLKQKQIQWTLMQQLLEDQKNEMEKRQDQIHQLDTKVHDLSYEIKTLLYLNEGEVSRQKPHVFSYKKERQQVSYKVKDNQKAGLDQENFSEVKLVEEVDTHGRVVQTFEEAADLLKKCIQLAQKLTGANYYSHESSRYREFSSSYFAIDQRRLFDSLQSEKGALIVVFSQKNHKLLFANSESKTLLGWSPEKFLSDFPLIMHEGIQEWRKALQMLTSHSQSQTRLLAKTKIGHEVLLNCCLGTIPKGIFRNYVIGIFYQQT